jgi:mycothione reductase
VFGGTCLNRGCIPTKMFVHTADLAHEATHSDRFGVFAGVDHVDWPAIRDRVFHRIDPIAAGGDRYRSLECPNVTVHHGRGRFVAPRQLLVREADGSETTIEGRQVVVAAGARPMIPDLPGIHSVKVHTSDDIMRIDRVPEHLIVLGGGFIACELAHVFGSLGAKVTIVQRGMRLLKAEDHDVSAAITTNFSHRFDLRCGVHVDRIEPTAGDGVAVHLADGTTIEGSHLLVATGRMPNSDVIDAEAGGLELHPDGRVVSDSMQRTSVPGVWARGDNTSPYMLKHVANHESRVVAHNVVAAARGEDLRETSHRYVPHAVFTNPQIASVGLTEMQAVAAGLDVMISIQRYGDIAYGWALEDTTSFCKLIAERGSRLLIGAHIIGPAASSLLQQLVQGMAFGQTIDQLARDQYYIHPALGELVENALLGFPPA